MLKYCAVFSLCAGLGLAADYMTGQAARAVIGQTTFTSQASGASNMLLGGVGGVAYANNTLFVTDSNRLGNAPINNRVLVFNNLSRMIPSATAEIGPNTGRCPVCAQGASIVLGQPDFTSTNYQTSANGMRLPDGSRHRWPQSGGGRYGEQPGSAVERDPHPDRASPPIS